MIADEVSEAKKEVAKYQTDFCINEATNLMCTADGIYSGSIALNDYTAAHVNTIVKLLAQSGALIAAEIDRLNNLKQE